MQSIKALRFNLGLIICLASVSGYSYSRTDIQVFPDKKIVDPFYLQDQIIHQNSEIFASRNIDLLEWASSEINDEAKNVESYSRVYHFGSWVNGENSNCNTRSEVLTRDSSKPVVVSANGCRVKSGLWEDPYTGGQLKSADVVQVDHLVPLYNVYYSGAHTWSRGRRCHYANFLSYQEHLKAVRYDENIRKGAKTPAEWLPPNQAYRCQYLKEWLVVKASWNLKFRSEEVQAIRDEMDQLKCPRKMETINYNSLMKLRAESQIVISACID